MKNEEKLINFWKYLLFLDKKVTEPHIDIDSNANKNIGLKVNM